MKTSLFLRSGFGGLILIMVLAGCGRRERNPDVPVSAQTPAGHPLTGEVIAVTPARSAVLVHHDEIPGYMPAMTMEFIVTPADLARLKEGRRFRARMTRDTKGGLHLEAVEPVDPVKEATIKAAAGQLRQDTAMRGREAYRELGENVPQFTLYDQTGAIFSINRARGKWIVMNFIYTRCPIATMCPASTQRMMDLQRAARGKGITNLQLLSISLDPVYDTPPVLKEYAAVRGIDTGNFSFLTGPEGAVRDLLAQFGVIVEPGENYLKHTLSTLLIDPQGRIAHRVDGTNWEPKDFLSRLPAEPGPAAAGTPATPCPPDSGESSLYRGPDGTIYLTWTAPGDHEGERALRFSTLSSAATTWSAPRTIISTPLLMENWADFASLIVGTDSVLTAQWFQRHGSKDSHGYDGWFARSADGGATWTTPASLGHEFVSLAPLSGGRTLAVWLESTRERDPHAPRPARDPDAPYAPSMRLRACLLSPEGSTLQDWIVDPDTCTCCQTTLAVLPGDRAIVAYRGHAPDEIRDNRVALFTGKGWTPPRSLHDDGWKIPACPVNGPAIDTLGERTAIAWFTAAAGVARVQAKQSSDGGLTFGPAVAIDLGRPIGRLDLVTLADGSSVVSWLEAGTEQDAAGLYVRRIFPDGALSAPQLVAATSSARASGFARMAARPGTELPVVIGWTETGLASSGFATPVTQVRTAGFPAAILVRAHAAVSSVRPVAGRFITVTGANAIEFLDLCSPASLIATGHQQKD